jgi:hypothetical protein
VTYEQDIDGWWTEFWKRVGELEIISCTECPFEKEDRCKNHDCGQVLADKFSRTYSEGDYEWL